MGDVCIFFFVDPYYQFLAGGQINLLWNLNELRYILSNFEMENVLGLWRNVLVISFSPVMLFKKINKGYALLQWQ